MAAINNQSHNYLSNQFLGGVAGPQGNLGGDEAGGFTGEGAIDMTHFAGNQFFTILGEETAPVPDGGSSFMLLVAGLGSLLSLRNSRK